jgi:hypothetical protein
LRKARISGRSAAAGVLYGHLHVFTRCRAIFARALYRRRTFDVQSPKEHPVDLVMVLVSIGLMAVFASLVWAMEKL